MFFLSPVSAPPQGQYCHKLIFPAVTLIFFTIFIFQGLILSEMCPMILPVWKVFESRRCFTIYAWKMVDLTELHHIQVSINQGDAFQPAFCLICFVDMRDERAADIDFNGNLKKTPFYVLCQLNWIRIPSRLKTFHMSYWFAFRAPNINLAFLVLLKWIKQFRHYLPPNSALIAKS